MSHATFGKALRGKEFSVKSRGVNKCKSRKAQQIKVEFKVEIEMIRFEKNRQ